MQSKDELVLDESIDVSKLGRRIREAREARSMTQEALATACDCVYKHIGAIENGRKKPSIELLMKISVALDVSLDALVQDSENAFVGYWIQDEFTPRIKQMTPTTRMALLSIMDQLIEVQNTAPKIAE